MQVSRAELVRPVDLPFLDRTSAGMALSAELDSYRHRDDVVVVALPRRGIPVARTVAAELGIPLAFLFVQKVRLPGYTTPVGAVAEGGIEVWNTNVSRGLRPGHPVVSRALASAQEALQRRDEFSHDARLPATLSNRCVIIVDDGLETGVSMRAAIEAVRSRGAVSIIVAVPAAPLEVVIDLRPECDEVICLTTPAPFHDLDQCYLNYGLTAD